METLLHAIEAAVIISPQMIWVLVMIAEFFQNIAQGLGRGLR